MDLDLGSKAVLKVKANGTEHEVHAPTVMQAEEYQKKIKADEQASAGAFLSLLEDLGMPREASEKLDVVQVQKLSEGLLGLVEKK